MNAKERYFWDLNGHLILRGVLNKKELAAANAAIDACADRISPGEPNCLSRGSESLQGLGRPGLRGTQLLNIEKPHCDIFKKMLVHPDVISRLRYMCGRGFRLDHGPQFIGGVKGTSGHRLHGAGAPHKPFVGYHHQDGEPHVGGVTVSWQLTEVIEGKGGFACVPGSHKSNFDAPDGVTSCDDHMGTVIQPGAQPGDVVFFMDGAQTHGTFPWQNDHERRSILYKFASRTSARTGPTGEVAPPTIYWDNEVVDDMSDEQLAVMWGPYSGHGGKVPSLVVDAAGGVKIEAGTDIDP
jgi:hypothetical protein